jgi:hypothetical protein
VSPRSGRPKTNEGYTYLQPFTGRNSKKKVDACEEWGNGVMRKSHRIIGGRRVDFREALACVRAWKWINPVRPSMMLGYLAGFLLGIVAAQADEGASEATVIADRAGFLLGHAHRCGINDNRLQRSESRLRELIAAFSSDDEDQKTAQSQFAARAIASALAQFRGDPTPSCMAVRTQLAQFEQHRPGSARDRADAARTSREGRITVNGTDGARPAKASKPPKERERSTRERQSIGTRLSI